MKLFIPTGSPLPEFLEPIYSKKGKKKLLKGYCLGFVSRKKGTVVIVGW